MQTPPEPELAIIGLGKRDVAFGASLPKPEFSYKPGTDKPIKIEKPWQVTQIMDQYCMMKTDANSEIAPGNIIFFLLHTRA